MRRLLFNSQWLVVLSFVFNAAAVPVENSPSGIPDNEGSVHYENVLDADNANSAYFLLEYYLFTRSNPTSAQRLYMDDVESIRSTSFNPEDQTVVIVHGFLGSHNSGLNPLIRDAYLEKGAANIIVLNWQRIGSDDEESAILGTPELGRLLGQFLKFLSQESGASYGNMHLIGFSLGAHLVGNAGKELGGQIARITGLDPAGRLWEYHPYRLSSSDAIYVEGIHTSEDFGINKAVGDVDFFPNGGVEQPGCLTPVCNHSRSWQFFAATVEHNHLEGRRCSTWLQLDSNLCFGDRLKMGNDELNKTGSGIYRVNTWWRYPY